MTDVFTKRKRSAVMARIRGRGNKETEVALAKLLRAHGITGWRRQRVIKVHDGKRHAGPSRSTKIRTDFIFPKQRVAVFVDGCFWHGCPLHSKPVNWIRKSSMPGSGSLRKAAKPQRTGKRFWREKLAGNMARDRRVNRVLRRNGWVVIRVWEHELKAERSQKVARRIRAALGGR